MSVKEMVTLPSTTTTIESKRVSKVALQPVAEPIMISIPVAEAIYDTKPKELYGSTENVVESEDTVTDLIHQDADPLRHQYASTDLQYASNDPEIQRAVLELENINPPT